MPTAATTNSRVRSTVPIGLLLDRRSRWRAEVFTAVLVVVAALLLVEMTVPSECSFLRRGEGRGPPPVGPHVHRAATLIRRCEDACDRYVPDGCAQALGLLSMRRWRRVVEGQVGYEFDRIPRVCNRAVGRQMLSDEPTSRCKLLSEIGERA